MEWQTRIRYFTKEEYEKNTQDFFYTGKWIASGNEIRVVKEIGIYAFNPKWNTIPDVIVGKYIGCGPINNGAPVSQEEEVEAVFNDYNKAI